MTNRMYNPFKWHIATNGTGKYVLRRMRWFTWEYMSAYLPHTYTEPTEVSTWCVLNSEQVAAERLFDVLDTWKHV